MKVERESQFNSRWQWVLSQRCSSAGRSSGVDFTTVAAPNAASDAVTY